MSDAVPTTIARGNVRCGFTASPAENVTYCQPSYAHSTPIMPRPMPDASDGVNAAGQNGAAAEGTGRAATRSPTLMINSAATLIAVLQFWTSALRLVPATLMAATTPSRTTAASFWPTGPSGTNCC